MPDDKITAVAEPPTEEGLEEFSSLVDAISDGALLPEDEPVVKPEDQEQTEPEPETEEQQPEPEPEGSAEEETDDGETNPAQNQPSPNEGMQRRIDKLTAQRSELNGQLNELRAQVAQLQAGKRKDVKLKPDSDPTANVQSIEELSEVVEKAEEVEQWAQRKLFALNKSPDAEDEILSEIKERFGANPADVGDYLFSLQQATGSIQRHGAPKAMQRLQQREQIAQQRQHWDKKAVEEYSWMADEHGEARARLDGVYNRIAEMKVRDIPEARLLLAHAFSGMAAKQKAAKVAPKPQAKPTSQPGTPKGARSKAGVKGSDSRKQFETVMERGDMASLASWAENNF